MKIDCLVCDLDGTLLDGGGKISRRNLAALRALQDRGVKIILASGRNDAHIRGLARQIGTEEAIIAVGRRADPPPEDERSAPAKLHAAARRRSLGRALL